MINYALIENALAYYEKLIQIIEYFVGQGHRAVTSPVHIKPSISGVFMEPDDYSDSSCHQINIRTLSGLHLLDFATKINPGKVDPAQQNLVLYFFADGVNKTAVFFSHKQQIQSGCTTATVGL